MIGKNVLLREPGTVIEYTKHQIEEMLKCINSCEYFIENYYKIKTVDGKLINFKPYDYQNTVLDTCIDNRFVIVNFPRQCLDLETEIPTPDGIKLFKNIHEGDYVFDEKGDPTEVIEESEVFYNKKCYKITFDNNEEIIATDDHLWNVKCEDWTYERTINTKELIDVLEKKNKNKLGLFIKKCPGVNYPEKKLLIDPYIMGYFLGDGCKSSNVITTHRDDVYNITKYLKFAGYSFTEKYYKNDVCSVRILKFVCQLKDLDLFHNKHIPIDYIYSSREQRISLIQGLMDTDGWSHKYKGSCEFYQKSKLIIDQFRIILASLGIKSRIREKIIKGEIYYIVSFRTKSFPVFRLKRKLDRQYCGEYRKDNDRIYFKSIEKCESVLTKCIKVDSQSELFCISDQFIPTHNSGKSTLVVAYMCWYVLFHENREVLLCSKTENASIEMLGRIKLALEEIPLWMQQGIIKNDARKIEFENRSSIKATATTENAGRSGSYSLIFCDEFAFVPSNIQTEFYASVLPTISSGKTSKMIIVSTPKGMNLFYKLYTAAERGENSFVPLTIDWRATPGRDEEWARQERRNIGADKFEQEYGCKFTGGEGSLVSPAFLSTIHHKDPIFTNDGLGIFHYPEEGHRYIITVDVSEGIGQDYSVASVIDVTMKPYVFTAKYRNNNLHILDLPQIIYDLANRYNEAYVLIEIGGGSVGIGDQVAKDLYWELEYSNLLWTTKGTKGVSNQSLVLGGGGQEIDWGETTGTKIGIKTTKSTKAIGCANIKTIIENGDFVFEDFDIIQELSTFVKSGDSFEAEDGSNDDLVMTLVLFGWLAKQPQFEYISGTAIGKYIPDSPSDVAESYGILHSDSSEICEAKYVMDSVGKVWEVVKVFENQSEGILFNVGVSLEKDYDDIGKERLTPQERKRFLIDSGFIKDF
jgi:hypothetical protein